MNEALQHLLTTLCKPGQDPTVLALALDEADDPLDPDVQQFAHALLGITLKNVLNTISNTGHRHTPDGDRLSVELYHEYDRTRRLTPSQLLQDITQAQATLKRLTPDANPGLVPILAHALLVAIPSSVPTIVVHLDRTDRGGFIDGYAGLTLSILGPRTNHKEISRITGLIRQRDRELSFPDTPHERPPLVNSYPGSRTVFHRDTCEVLYITFPIRYLQHTATAVLRQARQAVKETLPEAKLQVHTNLMSSSSV